MTEIIIDVNHLLAILTIMIPVTIIALRYFIKKEKCFTVMKAKINSLSKHDKEATDEHDGYDERLKAIESRQQKNEIYLKLLLDERNIKYD